MLVFIFFPCYVDFFFFELLTICVIIQSNCSLWFFTTLKMICTFKLKSSFAALTRCISKAEVRSDFSKVYLSCAVLRGKKHCLTYQALCQWHSRNAFLSFSEDLAFLFFIVENVSLANLHYQRLAITSLILLSQGAWLLLNDHQGSQF